MSEFVNTRDEIGDQATVDGLVSHTLTELKEDSVNTLNQYSIYHDDTLQTVEFPNISLIDASSVNNCTNLETVKIGGWNSSNSLTIRPSAFNGCAKLKHCIIDRPTVATIQGTSAFYGTPIYRGEGAIYVPSNLVNSYRENTSLSSFIFVPLSRYPLSVFESIADSWSTILTNSDYATDYAVKDTKTMELSDGTKIKMDLAALNTDVKADNSGNAKMTWICHGVPYMSKMSSSGDATGGWITCDTIYQFLQGILDKIPQEIKSHIVSVKKTYRTKSPNDETLSSNELIWIPSFKEVGFTNSPYVESDGVTYSSLFQSGTGTAANNTRIKHNTSGTAQWWLRSANNATSFKCVNDNGNASNYAASSEIGVVFGFCTD